MDAASYDILDESEYNIMEYKVMSSINELNLACYLLGEIATMMPN